MHLRIATSLQRLRRAVFSVLACLALISLLPLTSRPAAAATVQIQVVEGQAAIRWPAFRFEGRAFPGATAVFPRDGIWLAGVDLGNGAPLALPRPGHRGWMPLARVKVAQGRVSTVQALQMKVPASRIGKSLALLKEGSPLRVLVMGSSLQHASSSRVWPALMFSSSSRSPYRLKGTVQPRYAAIQGASNAFQLAQVAPLADLNAEGRIVPAAAQGTMLDNIDLVIVGPLANSGVNWEGLTVPLFTHLREAGVEVLVLTDNATIPTAQVPAADVIFNKGSRLASLAERFGFELADTAAYIATAHAAFPGSIYRDHIHMTEPVDPAVSSAVPAGHEVWARSVSSVFSLPILSSTTVSADPNEALVPAPPDEIEHVLLPATAVAKASSASNALAVHPWPRAIVASPQRAPASAPKVLNLIEGARFTVRAPCLSSLHLVWYGDARTGAAAVDLVHRDGMVRRTNLPGARPFPNLWMNALTLPVPAGASTDEFEVKVSGNVALDSLLVGRKTSCK